MRELALFSGAGGGILASVILGWRTVCAVELDTYASSVLVARQNDGILPPFPIWSDILSFDGHPWRGAVDIVSGGFPCQDISSAGRGEGLSGARSGLWFEMLRVIKEVRPSFVFIENSPMLARRGLGTVLEGLAQAGYDAAWTVLGADDVEAPHIRKRMWILAQAQDCRRNQFLPHADNERPGRRERESEGSPPQVGEMADSAGERHQETDLLSRDAGETKGHQEGLPERIAQSQLEKFGQIGGKLNPDWEEWLMGWPIGWSALEPLEMGRFHSWRLQHSVYCSGG